MPLVIDLSVVASWHFIDERNEWSQAILAMLRGGKQEARVPAIWWFELHHTLLRGERRQRTTLQQTIEFQAFIAELPFTITQNADADAVMTLARRHQLSFYDAAYLELAQRESLALATLDHALVRAAAAEGVSLIAA